MADKYASATTYNYAFNNPVVMNDPMGDDPKDPWRPKDPWKPKQDYQPGVSPISDAQAAMDRAGAMFDLVNGVNSPVWNSGAYGSAAGSGGRWGGSWGGVGKWIPLWKDWYNKDTGEFLSSEIIGWRYEENDCNCPDPPCYNDLDGIDGPPEEYWEKAEVEKRKVTKNQNSKIVEEKKPEVKIPRDWKYVYTRKDGTHIYSYKGDNFTLAKLGKDGKLETVDVYAENMAKPFKNFFSKVSSIANEVAGWIDYYLTNQPETPLIYETLPSDPDGYGRMKP